MRGAVLVNALSRALTIALLALPLLACARRIGTLPFSGEGTQSALLPLAAGKVAFWTDVDVTYVEPATLSYHIELLQGSSVVAVADCNPLGELPFMTARLETRTGKVRSLEVGGRMSCFAPLSKGGPTEVRATLAFGKRPSTATLKKVDLIVKQ
jgi:hypothetical protein